MMQVRVRSHFGDYYYLLWKKRWNDGRLDWRVVGQGQHSQIMTVHEYRGPSWFGANPFSTPPKKADTSSAGRPGADAPATGSQFGASLTDHANLKLGP